MAGRFFGAGSPKPMSFNDLFLMISKRCRSHLKRARSRGIAAGTGLLVWLAVLVWAVPASAAPVLPSAIGEQDEETRPAVSGPAAQRGGPPQALSRARTLDILVELQNRSAGLAVGGGARAYGSGALPLLPRRELSAAPGPASVAQASAQGGVGGGNAASGGADRSGSDGLSGGRPLEGSDESGRMHTLLAWVRENRALVAAAALALLALIWVTGMAVTRQRRR